MTPQQTKQVLRRIKYRKDWWWALDGDDICIRLETDDAYGRGRTYTRAYVVNFRKIPTVLKLVDRVADAIQRLENHEFGEWFKYRGRRIYDPHK